MAIYIFMSLYQVTLTSDLLIVNLNSSNNLSGSSTTMNCVLQQHDSYCIKTIAIGEWHEVRQSEKLIPYPNVLHIVLSKRVDYFSLQGVS